MGGTVVSRYEKVLRSRDEALTGSRGRPTPGYVSGKLNLDEIREAFELLPDWDEKYRYLIELGRNLPPLTDDERNDDNKVEGCMSQVWLVADRDEQNRIQLRADSDAFIVKGLVGVIIAMFGGKTPEAIAEVDAKAIFEELQLAQHLSMGRRNGLESMVKRIHTIAA